VITVPERHGRADRQTTYCGITSLDVASRGKNGTAAQYLAALSLSWAQFSVTAYAKYNFTLIYFYTLHVLRFFKG